MATSKSKGKLKKNMASVVKMKLGNKDSCETDTSDLSQLRKPIDINLSSLKQVAQLFEKGSSEVQDLLTYECDVIYECKTCRNLFRSIANLISHKRVYCLEKYGVKRRKYSADSTYSVYYKNNNNATKSIMDYVSMENCSNGRVLRSQMTKKEPKKDLTSVVDMLMKKQANDIQSDNIYNPNHNNCPLSITSDNEHVLLEMVDSNQAAYQTILSPQVSSNDDLMKMQTTELKNMSNGGTVFLGPDGQFHEIYPNIPSHDDDQDENTDIDFDNSISESNSSLTCTICNTKFATKKTLTFHIKCRHTPHRIGFPCPCCSSTFTNRSSVYRHLFKVHRKSNDQVRRLRSQIQARAFRRDTTRFEKSGKSSEAIDDQMREDTQNLITAQERMENLELDTELYQCSMCNKVFERKSVLMSHSQICKKRVARDQFKGRIKRVSKIPPQRVNDIVENLEKNSDINESTSSKNSSEFPSSTMETENLEESNLHDEISESPKETMEIAIRVEDVSSLSKDVWDMIGNDNIDINSETMCDDNSLTDIPSQSELPLTNDNDKTEAVSSETETSHRRAESTELPEVIYTSIDNSKPVELSVLETENKKLGIQYRGIRLPTVTLEKIKFIGNRIYEKPLEPAVSFKLSTSQSDVNRTHRIVYQNKLKQAQVETKLPTLMHNRKLQCVTCNRKFSSSLCLRRHITVHQRRSRYRCKLCDFKACLKCDSIAHCNKKHNARNNRAILAELIIEIPIKEVMDTPVGNIVTQKMDELEIIDVNRDELTEKIDSQENNNSSVEIATITKDSPIKVKPRRGRPKKKRTGGFRKKIVRKPRNVSPPSLSEDFHKSHEFTNIPDSLKIIVKQSPTKTNPPRIRAPSRMCCETEPKIRTSSRISCSDPEPKIKALSRSSSCDPEPKFTAPSKMSCDPEPRVRAPSRMSCDPEPRVRAPSRMSCCDSEPKIKASSAISSCEPEPQARAPSRMSCDPELRKMVMEVIFGPADEPKTESIEITDEINEIPSKGIDEKLETVVLDNRETTDQWLNSKDITIDKKITNIPRQNESDKRGIIRIQSDQQTHPIFIAPKISSNGTIITSLASGGHGKFVISTKHETDIINSMKK